MTLRQKTEIMAGLKKALDIGLISWGTYHALLYEVLEGGRK